MCIYSSFYSAVWITEIWLKSTSRIYLLTFAVMKEEKNLYFVNTVKQLVGNSI